MKNRFTYRNHCLSRALPAIALLAFLLLFAGLVPASRANELVTVGLQRHYTGDFNTDILQAGKPDKINFDVNRSPVKYQKKKDAPEPKPAAKQFIDKSKKKGISASGPEKLHPAFTGYFPRYHPDSFLLFVLPENTGLPDGENGTQQIRGPPLERIEG